MEQIEARMIIEIMGRPPAHVKETLSNLTEQLAKEKGVQIVTKKIHEPIAIKETKDLFTTFAEIELKFDSFLTYIGIVFAYMPSNVEVMTPTSFRLTNEEMSTMGNGIINRLHMYESVAKKLVSDRDILVNQLNKLTGKAPEIPGEIKPEVKKVKKKLKSKKK